MITTTIEAFAAHPEDFVTRVKGGETVTLTDAATPFAEIRPLAGHSPVQRQLGLSKGLVHIPASFFDPLPEDELALWSGETP
jgi:antitoxin (DNA-binding transcriptional repressor) of toxin-antitoxin stability system